MTANTSGERNNLKVAVVTASFACGMVGVAYAAVPLYQLFCQVTRMQPLFMPFSPAVDSERQ